MLIVGHLEGSRRGSPPPCRWNGAVRSWLGCAGSTGRWPPIAHAGHRHRIFDLDEAFHGAYVEDV
jgi:hypothetical protein